MNEISIPELADWLIEEGFAEGFDSETMAVRLLAAFEMYRVDDSDTTAD